MRIPLEFYEELRHNLRISDIIRNKVNLTKKGREYSGLCPFHSEKTPSFTVNDEKRFFHCFGCSAHGDVIKFAAEIHGLNYKEAAIRLANEYGIELPKISKAAEKQQEEADYIQEILNIANDFFQENLNEHILDYLKIRGLTAESIKNFSIGYSPGNKLLEKFMTKKSIPNKFLLKTGLYGCQENGNVYSIFNKRIMFPIRNIYNKIVGFGGRAIGNIMPKYINSSETTIFKKSEILYGENTAISQSYRDNYAIIVEGYMDVITLHQAGFKQAVASLGTAVSEKHLKKLWRSADEIIACLDGDNAGIRASNRLIELALPQISSEKTISFLELPQDSDPDDLIKNYGSKIFQQLLNKRRSLSEIIWKKEYAKGEFVTAEAKATLKNKLQNYLNLITDYSLRSNFQHYFKDMTWQYVIRRKVLGKKGSSTTANIIAIKKDSELGSLEKTICAFLLKHPILIIHCVEQIQLKDKILNDFKNWLESLLEVNSELNEKLIAKKVKNTRFDAIFELLSEFDSLSLDYNSLNDENINKYQILAWLCKKHYLLILESEYTSISSKTIHEEKQKRMQSYIREVQEVKKELSNLSEKLLIDNEL